MRINLVPTLLFILLGLTSVSAEEDKKAEIVPIPEAKNEDIVVIHRSEDGRIKKTVVKFTADDHKDAFAPKELECTYLVRVEHKYILPSGERTIAIGGGTAVAVDLGKYGFKGKKYLLTAAHLIFNMSSGGIVFENIYIQRNNGFIKCKLVKANIAMDLAVLECCEDLPRVAKLADTAPTIDSILINGGCPELVDPVVKKAKLIFNEHPKLWCVATSGFFHGSSGGPLFHNGKVVAIGVQGLLDQNRSIFERSVVMRGIGVFVPLNTIKEFLEKKE